MKRFTLILSLMVAMVTTAMAQAELPAEETFFRLKNTTSGLYMTVDSYNSDNQNAGGVNIREKNTEDLSKQVFRLKLNGDKYHILTFNNNVVSTFASWGFRAEAAYNNADLTIEAEEGDIWRLKGTKGYIGTNNDATSDGSILYSNHDAGKQNIHWMFEEVTTEEAELAATQVAPLFDASEIDANSCYTITAGDNSRGSWYSGENALTSTYKAAVERNAEDVNQQFAFIQKDDKYYLYSVAKKMFVAKDGDNTKYTKTAEAYVTFEKTQSYVAPYVIALNGENHMGISNGYDPAIITFYNGLTDGGNMATIVRVAEFDPSEALETFNTAATVTYEYQLNGNTLAIQEAAAVKGEAYPDLVIPTLPLGVVVTGAKPEGNVAGNETVVIALGVDDSKVPFEFVESGEPTTWYYAQMHAYTDANYSYRWFIAPAEDGTSIRTQDHEFAANETDSHLWGFVGTVEGGFKMVNKGSGEAIKSANSGVAAMSSVAEATAFIAMGSVIGDDWFCMKNPAGNYLNSQGKVANATNCDFVINHWSANDGGSSFYLTEYVDEDVTVTVSDAGWATMYLGEAVHVPAGVNAYIVTGVENGYLIKEQIAEGEAIPANTGILLENEGEYNFAKTVTFNVTFATNLLAGTLTETEIAKEEGNSYYILADGEEGIGFYNPVLGEDETKFNNAANKAYLVVPESVAPEVACYSFRFGEGTTGVEKVEIRNEKSEIFDLTGRRVENPSNGIYIINGVKVLVK